MKKYNKTKLIVPKIDTLIRQQLEVIDMNIESVDVLSVVEKIEVSKTRIEVFF